MDGSLKARIAGLQQILRKRFTGCHRDQFEQASYCWFQYLAAPIGTTLMPSPDQDRRQQTLPEPDELNATDKYRRRQVAPSIAACSRGKRRPDIIHGPAGLLRSS